MSTMTAERPSIWSVLFKGKDLKDFYKEEFEGITEFDFESDFSLFVYYAYDIGVRFILSPIGFVFDAMVLGMIIFSYVVGWNVFHVGVSIGIAAFVGVVGSWLIQRFIHGAGHVAITNFLTRSWFYSFRYFVMFLLSASLFAGGLAATLFLTQKGLPTSGDAVLTYLNPPADFDAKESAIKQEENEEISILRKERDNAVNLAAGTLIAQLEANEAEINRISQRKKKLTNEYKAWLKAGKNPADFNWANRIFIGVVQKRKCGADVAMADLRKKNKSLRTQIHDKTAFVEAKYEKVLETARKRKESRLNKNDVDEAQDEAVRADMIGIGVTGNVWINWIAAFLLFVQRFFVVAGSDTKLKVEELSNEDRRWSPQGILKYIFYFQWVTGKYTVFTAAVHGFRKAKNWFDELDNEKILEAERLAEAARKEAEEAKMKLKEKEAENDRLEKEKAAKELAHKLELKRKEKELAVKLQAENAKAAEAAADKQMKEQVKATKEQLKKGDGHYQPYVLPTSSPTPPVLNEIPPFENENGFENSIEGESQSFENENDFENGIEGESQSFENENDFENGFENESQKPIEKTMENQSENHFENGDNHFEPESQNFENEPENFENDPLTKSGTTLHQSQKPVGGQQKNRFEPESQKNENGFENENNFENDFESESQSFENEIENEIEIENDFESGFENESQNFENENENENIVEWAVEPKTESQKPNLKNRIVLRIEKNELLDGDRVGASMSRKSNILKFKEKIYVRSDGSISEKDYNRLVKKGYNLNRNLVSDNVETKRAAKESVKDIVAILDTVGYKMNFDGTKFSKGDKYGNPSLGLSTDNPKVMEQYIEVSEHLKIEEA